MNKVVHFEIPANDLKRAEDFYSKIFGWKIEGVPMPDPEIKYDMAYTTEVDEKFMPKVKGAINGALMKRQDNETPRLVIDVESVDEHSNKIVTGGGKILAPKQKVMDMGYYVKFEDPEGNVLAIWEDIKK